MLPRCSILLQARRVLFAVQLQDRGEHRARYVTAHETFENVVITLFDFEQGTDAHYHDCITSFFYSAWIPYVPRPTQEQSVGAPARQAERRLLIRDRRVRMLVAERRLAGAPRNGVLQYGKHEEANESFMFENA